MSLRRGSVSSRAGLRFRERADTPVWLVPTCRRKGAALRRRSSVAGRRPARSQDVLAWARQRHLGAVEATSGIDPPVTPKLTPEERGMLPK